MKMNELNLDIKSQNLQGSNKTWFYKKYKLAMKWKW
jgi:hypothetical protein